MSFWQGGLHLKTCANTAATTFVLTACGNIFSTDAHAQVKPEEVLVNEDNFITTVEELEAKKAVNFEFGGRRSILLYNDGSNIKAYENICTHKICAHSKNGATILTPHATKCLGLHTHIYIYKLSYMCALLGLYGKDIWLKYSWMDDWWPTNKIVAQWEYLTNMYIRLVKDMG